MPYYPPSGGGTFNPHSPGPIGDVTPNTVNAIGYTSTGFSVGASGDIIGLSITANGGNLSGDNVISNGLLLSDGGGFLTDGSGNVTLNGITATGLPTSDPSVAGEFWSNLGIVTMSNG